MALQYPISIPTALEYFAALVSSDEQLPLLEAVACIAHDEHPDLDLQQLLDQVDQLQARLRRRMPADAGGLQRLQLLNHFFYNELGFGGNSNDFYDPENSYLHTVLRTRRGIPVSLAVLWLELAQAIELPVRGVAFPGHFLVKVLLAQGQVVLDPLSGQSLSREALLAQLEPFVRRHGWQGEVQELPLDLYLQPASGRDILARMLRNLKEIHQAQRDDVRLLAVLDRLIVLQPQAWDEWRDRGLVHAECGHYPQAVADLENYLAHVPQGPQVQALVQRLGALKAP